jgi:hypothetical protein
LDTAIIMRAQAEKIKVEGPDLQGNRVKESVTKG